MGCHPGLYGPPAHGEWPIPVLLTLQSWAPERAIGEEIRDLVQGERDVLEWRLRPGPGKP